MKVFFSLFCLSLFAVSCSGGSSDGFLIRGELAGEIPDGTPVILRRSDVSMQAVDVDTTSLTAGTFEFAGAAAGPELYYVFVEGLRGGIPLILENGTIYLQAHKDSLQEAVIGGTPQNEAYSDYIGGARDMGRRRMGMNEDLRNAMMQQDTAAMESLRDEYFELLGKMTDYEKEFAAGHPDALISVLILNRMLENQSVPVAEIDSLYQKLDETVRNSNYGKAIADKLEAARRTAIGSPAPDFSAPTPQGNELALRDALGKITLVDFWAAWCRPCRAENPNIVRIYGKYKDKGLRVLGVSLDRNAEEWKAAIIADGLDWQHVSNVRYFDEIAALYNVDAIPASFILDENGIIVDKDLRGAQLEARIAELLP